MPREWESIRRRRLVAAALILTAVAACTAPTPYQPASEGQGYSDQRLEEDRYRVSFSGNSRTPRETVENYLLYRAAEITRQSGNAWFRIVDQDTDKMTEYFTTVSGFPGPGLAPFPYRYYYYPRPVLFDATSRPVTRYQAFAVIVVHQGERPADDDNAYDAAQVMMALGPTIVRESSW